MKIILGKMKILKIKTPLISNYISSREHCLMGIVYKKGAKYRQTKMTIFSMRTLISVAIFILGFLILVRKQRLPFHRDKFQFNVVTLKETLGIVAIFYLNSFNYFIGLDRYLEMFILRTP